MSHYRRRAGLCAPLFLAVTLRVMMGVGLSQFALPGAAQAPAPLPLSAQSIGSSANSVLIPDRGDVTVLKLDDQLRVGKPIADGNALTFTSSDSIDGIVDREMRLKGRAQIRRNGAVIKADEIKYDPDSDVANLSGNTEFSKGNASFKGPKARFRVDAREGEMETPNYELRDNRASGNAKKLTIETADVFVFDTSLDSVANVDLVSDLVATVDRLKLDDDVFAAFTVGVALTASQFVSGAGIMAAQTAEQRIVYDTSTGALYYDADGLNGEAAVQFAILGSTTHLVLGAGDFVVAG